MPYEGRLRDLLVMGSVSNDGNAEQVQFSLSGDSKVTAGIQKIAQQWLTFFLSRRGSSKSDPTFGASFLNTLSRGEKPRILETFNIAVNEYFEWLDSRDNVGVLLLDEVPQSIDLVDFSIVDGTLRMVVNLVSEAGNSVEYLVPLSITGLK